MSIKEIKENNLTNNKNEIGMNNQSINTSNNNNISNNTNANQTNDSFYINIATELYGLIKDMDSCSLLCSLCSKLKSSNISLWKIKFVDQKEYYFLDRLELIYYNKEEKPLLGRISLNAITKNSKSKPHCKVRSASKKENNSLAELNNNEESNINQFTFQETNDICNIKVIDNNSNINHKSNDFLNLNKNNNSNRKENNKDLKNNEPISNINNNNNNLIMNHSNHNNKQELTADDDETLDKFNTGKHYPEEKLIEEKENGNYNIILCNSDYAKKRKFLPSKGVNNNSKSIIPFKNTSLSNQLQEAKIKLKSEFIYTYFNITCNFCNTIIGRNIVSSSDPKFYFLINKFILFKEKILILEANSNKISSERKFYYKLLENLVGEVSIEQKLEIDSKGMLISFPKLINKIKLLNDHIYLRAINDKLDENISFMEQYSSFIEELENTLNSQSLFLESEKEIIKTFIEKNKLITREDLIEAMSKQKKKDDLHKDQVLEFEDNSEDVELNALDNKRNDKELV